MSISIKSGEILKVTKVMLVWILFLTAGVMAQSPDTLLISTSNAPPGGVAEVTISLHNTQFSVSGFSTRIVLADSTVAAFSDVQPGADVSEFEYFDFEISEGTCRVIGLSNLPGGGNPPPLEIGQNELAVVSVSIDDYAPWGYIDSVFFADDGLPPERDNSISDSTGYINEVPTMIHGMILFDIFENADDSSPRLPSKINLSQNYPNPFNAQTRISFTLPDGAASASIGIYNVIGRLVRSYDWSHPAAGAHDIVWDGTDSGGNEVASGIYFYRLAVEGNPVQTMRMTLLK